jgi:hypothetical protein
MSDRRGLEQVGGDLVQERLEGVVVVLVDQHDVDIRVLQRQRCAQTCKASPEDQDPRSLLLAITRHLPPPAST